MFPLNRVHIRKYERGLLFDRGVFERMLMPGDHLVFDLLGRKTLEMVSVRHVSLTHRDLAAIVRSGALAGQALVLELRDHERALLWVEGRLVSVLEPGLHALWTVFHEVRADVVDTGRLVGVECEDPRVNFSAAGRRAGCRFHQGRPSAGLDRIKAPSTIGGGVYSLSGNLVPAVRRHELHSRSPQRIRPCLSSSSTSGQTSSS